MTGHWGSDEGWPPWRFLLSTPSGAPACPRVSCQTLVLPLALHSHMLHLLVNNFLRSVLVWFPNSMGNRVCFSPLLLSVIICCCCVRILCLTLCDPMDCSPPGSSVHGILQARVLEWVAMPSSRGSSQPRDQTHVSCISCIGRQILYHYSPWEDIPLPPNIHSPIPPLSKSWEITPSHTFPTCPWKAVFLGRLRGQ